MSVVSLSLSLPREQVLRCLDYPPGRGPNAGIGALLDEILVEARTLVEPRGTWRAFLVERAAEVGLEPIAAEGLALGLVTIGPALEERVTAYQQEGEMTRALLLDACGSAAAEAAADALCARMLGEPGAAVGAVGCRLSPGYGRWGLEHQPALLDRLGAEALGVILSPSFLMVPRKSISFASWLGADGPPAPGLAGCDRCGLARCRYGRS